MNKYYASLFKTMMISPLAWILLSMINPEKLDDGLKRSWNFTRNKETLLPVVGA